MRFENNGPSTGASAVTSSRSSNSVFGGSRKNLEIFFGTFMRGVMVTQGDRLCRSRTQEAALGMDDLARYPGGLIAGQERYEPRSILGLPDPPEGKFRHNLPPRLLVHPARICRTRVDGIDRDPLVPDLGGERPGESLGIHEDRWPPQPLFGSVEKEPCRIGQ